MPYVPRKRAYRKPAAKPMRKPMVKRMYKRPATFAKKVQAVMNKSAETKSIQFFMDNLPVSSYDVGVYGVGTNQMNQLPLSPDGAITPIAQGTNAQQRIGNSIKLSKVTVRGIISPRAYQATASDTAPANTAPIPFLFKMWVGYQRDTELNEVEPSLPAFFQLGNTTENPTGTLMDTFRKVNTEKYVIVATRTFKVGYGNISFTSGAGQTNQAYNNNDFKLNQKFSLDVTKHCIKTLKFNDSNNTPKNRSLYWWFEAVDATGSEIATGNFPAEISFELDIQYKDI